MGYEHHFFTPIDKDLSQLVVFTELIPRYRLNGSRYLVSTVAGTFYTENTSGPSLLERRQALILQSLIIDDMQILLFFPLLSFRRWRQIVEC